MGLYSIKDLSQLTSIKTHTIRMWEKRYGILKPKRTETNNRYYCQSEVTLLSNIAFLTQNGFKIGKIAALTEDEVNNLAERTRQDRPGEEQIDRITIAIINFDALTIEETILKSFEDQGVYETFLHTLLPIAARLNLLLMTGKIRQVHIGHYFNLVKKIYISEASRIPANNDPDALHLVIYPYKSNKQFVSVAAINCGLRLHNIKCTELGQDCPVEDLTTVYATLKPDAFVTVIHDDIGAHQFLSVIGKIVSAIGNTPLYVVSSENLDTASRFPLSVRFFPNVNTLVEYSTSLKPAEIYQN